MENECYYCNEKIPASLAFCPNCGEPLTPCPSCGRYNSSVANYCFRCVNRVELPIDWDGSPEWASSLTIERLATQQGEPKKIDKEELQRGQHQSFFLSTPTAAFGFLFVISTAGDIFVLNKYNLKGCEQPLLRLPLGENEQVFLSPIIIKRKSKDADGFSLHERYLCVASQRHLFLLYISASTAESIAPHLSVGVSLSYAKGWPVELPQECTTPPIWVDEKLIVGTEYGVSAYSLQGEKLWFYGEGNSLRGGMISTPLLPVTNAIFFGTSTGTEVPAFESKGYIHAVTTSGQPFKTFPYPLRNTMAGKLLWLHDENRVVFHDERGLFYSLDASGSGHYAPSPLAADAEDYFDATRAIACVKGYIYLGTLGGRLYCISTIGDKVGSPYICSPGHSFLNEPAVSQAGLIAFLSRAGNLYLIDANSMNRTQLQAQALPLGLSAESSPLISGGYLYLITKSGIIMKLGKSQDVMRKT